MNRVSIVNLAGHAWHVEDEGVAALDAWLAEARTRLAGDPDVDELLADFERAIDERLRAHAPGERDVVTAAHVAGVLGALGAVEPADDATTGSNESAAAAAGEPAPAVDVPLRERRLYRLTGEDEAMLGGVCAGLAAYLHLDVTVVRVLAVVLAFLTSGAALLVYVAMWLIVPEADTPEQRAQARGAGLTAEEMLARAREGASPALARLGSLIERLAVALAHVVRWTLLLAIWALLVAWGVVLGWLLVDPGALLQAFDQGTSAWIVGLWVTCVAWVPLAVLILLERVLAMATAPASRRRRRASAALVAVVTASFVLAIVGANAIPATHSSQLASLEDGHGSVRIADHTFCFEGDDGVEMDGDCDPADTGADEDAR